MVKVYICSPHRLNEINETIANVAGAVGNTIYLPQDFCRKEDETKDYKIIRRKCIEAIDNADIFVMYIDDYGMDSAWELGYAEKARKKIIGLSLDKNQLNTPKTHRPQTIWEHWMHGWKNDLIVEEIYELLHKIKDKKVYISIPVRQRNNFASLENKLKSSCNKLYVPWDIVSPDILLLPKEKWNFARNKCIEAINDADIFVMYIDDYGMDSAWELGYAEKARKKIIGLSLDKNQLNTPKTHRPQTIWEHWMHGWKEHTIVHDLDMLMKILKDTENFKIPVVCPIIEKENKNGSIEILVQTRKNPKDKRYYGIIEIPGGKIRYNETIIDALKREVKEECGLDVEPIGRPSNCLYKIRGSIANLFEPYTIAEEVGDHSYVGIFIKCRVVGGILSPTAEGADQKWISTKDLKKLIDENKVLPINAPGLIKYIEQNGGRI